MNETISSPSDRMEVATDYLATERSGRIWKQILIWGGVILLLGLLAVGLLKAGESRPEAGDMAPTFAMELFDGYGWEGQQIANLDDMKGNVVVLNFWASWCIECRVEADLLEQTWQRYRDQGVIFLGVAYVDAEHKALAYLDEFDITYPNGADLGSAVSKAYKITGVPETFFIGKDGAVSRYVLGPVSANTLVGEIETLLAQ